MKLLVLPNKCISIIYQKKYKVLNNLTIRIFFHIDTEIYECKTAF